MQLLEKSKAGIRHFAAANVCLFFGVFVLHVPAVLPAPFPPASLCVDFIDSPISTDSRAGRLAVFDDVWQTVFDRYYDSSFGGIDWEKQKEHFRPLAENAAGGSQLYSILREMIASLRDAHTRVIPPNEISDWRSPTYIGVGIRTREIDGSDVVIGVEPASAASRSGVTAGDVILSIDGKPPQKQFRTRNIFDGIPESPVRIVWQNQYGIKSEITLKREIRTKSASLTVVSSKSGISVLKVDSFSEQILKQLQDMLAVKRRHKRALIVDLRNNGGGDTEVMTAIASIFLPAGTSLGSFFDREGRVSLEPRTAKATALSSRDLLPFNGEVVLLTGRRTASAAEIFVSTLRHSGRAKLVGEKTCGCVLAIRSTHSLPDGGALEVSELDYRTAQGSRLEGQGIVPDVEVPLSISDIREGRDRAMEVAMEMLKDSRRH